MLCLLLLAAGCRYQMEPVPMLGAAADLARLEGAWHGEYAGRESQRLGLIDFTITAHGDSAFGHVLLTQDAGNRQYLPAHERQEHLGHAPSEMLLYIGFVEVRGGIVVGQVEPYIAPDCQCVAVSVFVGTLSGDRIRGTYFTRRERGPDQTGEWSVQRKARATGGGQPTG
jgi:hypothetical protein